MTALAAPTTATGEMTFSLSAFTRLTDTNPVPVTLTWPHIVRRLSVHQEREERDGPGWSPAIYRPGATRGSEGVEAVTLLTFDVDDEYDPAPLERYEYFAHTTHSHTPEAPRYRVILPLTRRVDAGEWSEVWERARLHLCPNADVACKDASRFYYKPSCRPGAERRSVHHPGEILDLAALPPLPPVEESKGATVTPLPAPSADGRPGDDYNARVDWREILEPHGWQFSYRRGEEDHWLRPGKRRGEGISATTNFKGSNVLKVFSSNAAPFEADSTYEPFAAYALLEHGGDFKAAAKVLAAKGFGAPVAVNSVISRTAAPVSSVSSVCSLDTPPVAAFPTAALPDVARELVMAGASALDCPPDLLAAPLLAMAGGVIGNRHQLELKPGYRQRPTLWVASVADPGTAKSPAQSLVQKPLDALQKEAHERRVAEKEAYQAALDAWQSEDKQFRGPRPVPPAEEEHFYTTDSTVEAIAKMLGSDRSVTPGFSVLRDELTGWVQSFDAYRKGGDRQAFLTLWNGAALKSDRAGRETIYVPEPVVGVGGGIQPDLLPELAPEAGQRDGFIERILFAYPVTRPMRWNDRTVDERVLVDVAEAYRALRAAEPSITRLSGEAHALYEAWVNDNADLQEAVTGIARGYYAKLPNQAARIALVLHCLAYPTAPGRHLLSGETMRDALAITEYFRSHAQRALSHFGAAVHVDHPKSVRIYAALEKSVDWLSTAKLHKELGGHLKADDLRGGLDALIRARLVERRERTPSEVGGRPGSEFRAIRQTSKEQTEETEQTPTFAADEAEEVEWTA